MCSGSVFAYIVTDESQVPDLLETYWMRLNIWNPVRLMIVQTDKAVVSNKLHSCLYPGQTAPHRRQPTGQNNRL